MWGYYDRRTLTSTVVHFLRFLDASAVKEGKPAVYWMAHDIAETNWLTSKVTLHAYRSGWAAPIRAQRVSMECCVRVSSTLLLLLKTSL